MSRCDARPATGRPAAARRCAGPTGLTVTDVHGPRRRDAAATRTRTREPTPGHRAAPTRGIGRGALTRAGHPMSMPVNAAGDGWRTEMSSQLGGALSKRHVGGPDPGGGVRRRRLLSAAAAIALAAGLAPVASNAAHGAATPLVAPAINPVVASSTQFDITGFLQSATLDSAGDPHSGGTLTLNGHAVVVPKETIVILPASALTWQELFTH